MVVGGVDLDAVDAASRRARPRRHERLDDLLDLGDGQRVRRLLLVDVERRAEGHGRRGDPHPVDRVIRRPRDRGGRTAGRADSRTCGPQPRELSMSGGTCRRRRGSGGRPSPCSGHSMAGVSTDDQAGAAPRHRPVEGLGDAAEASLARLEEVGLRGGLDDPVLQLDLADVDRRKKVLIPGMCHQRPPRSL